MCGETSNLVAETLGRDQGDLVGNLLVGLEIEGEARVVLFNQDTRSLLNGFGSDATLLVENRRVFEWTRLRVEEKPKNQTRIVMIVK